MFDHYNFENSHYFKHYFIHSTTTPGQLLSGSNRKNSLLTFNYWVIRKNTSLLERVLHLLINDAQLINNQKSIMLIHIRMGVLVVIFS